MKSSLQVQMRGLQREAAREQGSVRSLLLPLACFALGLAVSRLWIQRGPAPGQTRQPAPELSDGTKAIPSAAPANAATVEEIRQLIANIDSVSLEEGIRILREDSVKEFSTAAGEMQAQVQEAQARVVQARNSGSPAEQDSAIKNLQTVQAEQARRLKEIAANSQARIDAFKRLKSGAK